MSSSTYVQYGFVMRFSRPHCCCAWLPPNHWSTMQACCSKLARRKTLADARRANDDDPDQARDLAQQAAMVATQSGYGGIERRAQTLLAQLS